MFVFSDAVFLAISEDSLIHLVIFAIAALGSIIAFISAIKARKNFALMSATQTSSISDLKSGPAEVSAVVKDGKVGLKSPWSDRECVYYRFYVETLTRGRQGGELWLDYIDDSSSESILVEDETGEMEVLVKEAEMDMKTDRFTESGYGNDAPEQLRSLLTSKYGKDTQGLIFNKDLRYTETYLERGDRVYIFGDASKVRDGRWIMRDGKMPLIITEKGEAVVQREMERETGFGCAISLAVIAVITLLFWLVKALI